HALRVTDVVLLLDAARGGIGVVGADGAAGEQPGRAADRRARAHRAADRTKGSADTGAEGGAEQGTPDRGVGAGLRGGCTAGLLVGIGAAGGVFLLELSESLALRRQRHDGGALWRRDGAGAECQRRQNAKGEGRAAHDAVSSG